MGGEGAWEREERERGGGTLWSVVLAESTQSRPTKHVVLLDCSLGFRNGRPPTSPCRTLERVDRAQYHYRCCSVVACWLLALALPALPSFDWREPAKVASRTNLSPQYLNVGLRSVLEGGGSRLVMVIDCEWVCLCCPHRTPPPPTKERTGRGRQAERRKQHHLPTAVRGIVHTDCFLVSRAAYHRATQNNTKTRRLID